MGLIISVIPLFFSTRLDKGLKAFVRTRLFSCLAPLKSSPYFFTSTCFSQTDASMNLSQDGKGIPYDTASEEANAAHCLQTGSTLVSSSAFKRQKILHHNSGSRLGVP